MRRAMPGHCGNVGLPIGARFAVIAGALMLLSGYAFGTVIPTGQGNTAGTVLVNSAGIFFSNFVSIGPNTGSYAGMTSTVQGNLVGSPTLTPNLTDWAEFGGTVTGLIMFDLQSLNPGYGTLAGCASDTVGNTCTPAGSPVTLAQIGVSSVAITLSGSGVAYTGTNATSSPTIVSFTSQNNVPGKITAILALVNSESGFTDSVSATYSTTGPDVPEPATFSMMGFGLLGLGLVVRRRKR